MTAKCTSCNALIDLNAEEFKKLKNYSCRQCGGSYEKATWQVLSGEHPDDPKQTRIYPNGDICHAAYYTPDGRTWLLDRNARRFYPHPGQLNQTS